MTEVSLLQDGEIAVVILARDSDVPTSFQFHPQLLAVPVGELATTIPDVSAKIPSTTKVVLIAGELPTYQFSLVRKVAERRNIPYLTRRSGPALAEVLQGLLPPRQLQGTGANGNGHGSNGDGGAETGPPAKPAKPTQSMAAYVEANWDPNRGGAENARMLQPKLIAAGYQTNFNSIAQCISALKRKTNRTGVPNSVRPPSVRALNTLDEAIAGLQLLREYVENTEAENIDLREKLEKFKKILA